LKIINKKSETFSGTKIINQENGNREITDGELPKP